VLISVIMPVYRRARLACNAAACFLGQALPRDCSAELIVIDDGGTFSHIEAETRDATRRIELRSFDRRFPSLAAKYNAAVESLETRGEARLAVLFDDDDVYLPWHLSAHVTALAEDLAQGRPAWSKPARVWSDYSGTWKQEDAAGRFHGSIAFSLPCPVRWDTQAGPDFDQRFMTALRNEFGRPRDPLSVNPVPGYGFRWHTHTWHVQHFDRYGESWYDELGAVVPPMEPAPLVPEFDSQTIRVLKDLGGGIRG